MNKKTHRQSQRNIQETEGVISLDLNVPYGDKGTATGSTKHETKTGQKWWEIIRHMREQAGLTQEGLLRKVIAEGGPVISQSNYARWEMGQRKIAPEWKVFASIAFACGYNTTDPLFLKLKLLVHGRQTTKEELLERFLIATERILASPQKSLASKTNLFKDLRKIVTERPEVAETILDGALAQDTRNLSDWLSVMLSILDGNA